MSEDYPRETAFDSRGNPLFTIDGNLASAADAARFPNAKLYAYGESLHAGPVYDGWGRQVRGGGELDSGSVQPSGDFVDGVIDKVVGGVILAAIIGFFTLVSEPLDRWLMNKAKEQTSHASELEKDVASVSGLNIGGIWAPPIWLLFFVRLPFAVIPIALLTVVMLVPLFGQLCVLLVWGLVLIRGNEWSWYSGKWATVDDFMAAKRRWAYGLLVYMAIASLVYFCYQSGQ